MLQVAVRTRTPHRPRGFFQLSRQTPQHEPRPADSLCNFQDGKYDRHIVAVEQTTAAGGNMLIVTLANTEKGAELVMASAEPISGVEFLEAAHTSDPTFDAPVILFDPIILVGAGSVLHTAESMK